jgi:hypothetical protein
MMVPRDQAPARPAALTRGSVIGCRTPLRWQRSHVNTGCKLLLLGHAFDTLGCKVVGLRIDNFNQEGWRHPP